MANTSILPASYKASFVVKDMTAAKAQWAEVGITEWGEFDYEGLAEDITVGNPFVAKFAQGKMGDGVVVELVQPVTGDSVWQQALDSKGEGFHLHAFSVPNSWDKTVDSLKQAGGNVLVQANFDGLRWCYVEMALSGMIRFEITEEEA